MKVIIPANIIFKAPTKISDEQASAWVMAVEYYNPMDEDIFLKNEIIKMNITAAKLVQHRDGVIGEEFYVVPSKGFCKVPHQFFMAYTKSGSQELRMHINYGRKIGTGNKMISPLEKWSGGRK